MRTQAQRIGAARRLASVCGAIVAVAGVAILVGWAFGIAPLKAVTPGMVTTKANAALGLVVSGSVLLLRTLGAGRPRLRAAVADMLVLLGLSIGLLTLVEYVVGVNLGIDQLLFHEPYGAWGTAVPGRMSALTAAALTVSAVSLALIDRGRAAVQQVLAIGVALIALSGTLTYIYRLTLEHPPASTEASAQTMAAFLVLGVGLLAARPGEDVVGSLLGDTPGAVVSRSLIAVGVLLAPAVGALRLLGEEAGLYGSGVGVELMVIISLVALVTSTALTARRLNLLDRERSNAVQRLAASEQRLRRTLEQLVQVKDIERRRLAGDLHDDAVPALAAISLQLELARGRCQDGELSERLERAEADLRAAVARLRHVIFDLMPEALAKEGVGPALHHRLEQMRELSGVDYQLRDRIGTSASSEAAATLYRVTLEALRNVERHAQAGHVRVELARPDGLLKVTVADDGIGLGSAADGADHFGLAMMRDRLELAGGGLTLSSTPGAGTTVVGWLPGDVSSPVAGSHSIRPPRMPLATAAARSDTSSLS